MVSENTQPADILSDSVAQDGDERHDTPRDTVGLESDLALPQVVKTVEAGIERLLEAFDEKIRYDQSQQSQLDRLHAELQEHRADLLAKATRPLAYGMIRIHNDIERLRSALSQEEAEEEQMSQRFVEMLGALKEDVELELGKHGILTIRDDCREVDPKRQRVVRRVLVGERDLDGVVEMSINCGFEQGEYILTKESVSAFKFDPALNGEDADREAERSKADGQGIGTVPKPQQATIGKP